MERFLSVMSHGEHCIKHQCCSKFQEMNKSLTKFNDIYKNLLTQRKSRENDQQIFKTSLKIFFVNTKKFFKFIDVRRFLSASPKWIKEYGEEEEGGEKRTKVSETS